MTVLNVGVFEVSDHEYWAGAGDATQVQNAYMEKSDKDHNAAPADGLILPLRLSDASLDDLKIRDEFGNEQTFRQRLAELVSAGVEFPCFFASLQVLDGRREDY